MAEMKIRRMTYEDAEAVHAIEEAAFATPWSLASFKKEMSDNRCARYLLAVLDDEIIGFAGMWVVLDEGHITNIAIKEKYRGQGFGKALTTALVQYAANLGVDYMTLEVRKSNLVAQRVYSGLGFVQVGVRKKYYEDNGEDALFMVCDKLPCADENFEEAETVHE